MAKTLLFISQPFHGRTEEEIFEERRRILEKAKLLFGDAIDVIDQYHQEKPDGEGKLWYLSQDILMMEKATWVIFSPKWKEARGCRIEHMICEEYGFNTMEL